MAYSVIIDIKNSRKGPFCITFFDSPNIDEHSIEDSTFNLNKADSSNKVSIGQILLNVTACNLFKLYTIASHVVCQMVGL